MGPSEELTFWLLYEMIDMLKTRKIIFFAGIVSDLLGTPQESFSADDARGLQKYISWSENLDLGRIAEHFKDLPISKEASPQDTTTEEQKADIRLK